MDELIGHGQYGNVYAVSRQVGERVVRAAVKIVDIPRDDFEALGSWAFTFNALGNYALGCALLGVLVARAPFGMFVDGAQPRMPKRAGVTAFVIENLVALLVALVATFFGIWGVGVLSLSWAIAALCQGFALVIVLRLLDKKPAAGWRARVDLRRMAARTVASGGGALLCLAAGVFVLAAITSDYNDLWGSSAYGFAGYAYFAFGALLVGYALATLTRMHLGTLDVGGVPLPQGVLVALRVLSLVAPPCCVAIHFVFGLIRLTGVELAIVAVAAVLMGVNWRIRVR